MSAADFPAIPADAPTVSVSERVTDRNGYAYATDSLHLSASRRFRDGAPVLWVQAVEEAPDDDDDTPEGFADVFLTLDQARALRDGLPALVAYLESLPTEPTTEA